MPSIDLAGALEAAEHLRFLPHPKPDPRPHARFGALIVAAHSSRVPGTLIAVLGGVVISGWLVLGASAGIAMLSNPKVGAGAVVFVELVISLVGLLGLALLRIGLRSRKQGVHVYEHGLLREDREGTTELAWTEADGVRSRTWTVPGDLDPRPQGIWWIHAPNRKPIVVDRTLPHHYEIGSEIERRVAASSLARYRALMASGQPLGFGPVSLDPSGIRLAGATCTWQELDKVVHRRDLAVAALGLVAAGMGAGEMGRWVLALRPKKGLLDLAAVRCEEVLNLSVLLFILEQAGVLEESSS